MTDAVQGAPQGAPNDPPQGEVVNPPVRPDNVPEKFWDAEKGAVNTEALLASYTELEKSRTPPQDPPQGEPPVDPNAPPQPSGDATPEAVKLYNETVEKATAELQSETGQISDETYASFEKQGITRAQIDTYVEGQHAKMELRKIYAEREVGGEDTYKSLIEWAGANYSSEDAEAFNNAVFGASRDVAMEAVRGLKQRYEAAMGNDGKIVTNGTSGTAHNGYKSKDEWFADMRKPEYKKDAAFRDQVRVKLEASLKAGVNMGIGTRVG